MSRNFDILKKANRTDELFSLTPADGQKTAYSEAHRTADSQEKLPVKDIFLEAPPGPARPMPPPRPAEPAPEFGGLVDYVHMLGRHQIFIAASTLGCALFGLLTALPQKPVYRAHATIEIQNPNENFLMKDLDPGAAPSVSGSDSYVETQARILRDESTVEKTVVAVNLEQRPDLITKTNALVDFVAGLQPARAKQAPPSRDELVRLAIQNLTVQTSAQSRIVDVFFDSTDAQLAADFANKLAENLIEHNLEVRWMATKRLGEWLNGELKGLRETFLQSSGDLQAYARATGLMIIEEKGTTAAEERLRQLQEELSRAQADRISKQSRYEVSSSRSAEALPDVLDYPTLRESQSKLTELRRQLADLNAAFLPTYPKVKSLQAQVTELESIVQKERSNIVDRVHNEYLAAKSREQMDRTVYEQQVGIVADQAAKAIQYNLLKHGVDSNRTLYETLLQKVKEANVASAIRASNIRIISEAKRPWRPYKPNAAFNAGMGLLAGLFLSVAFVFVREHADRSLRSPGDAATFLNLPELAAIPSAALYGRSSLGLAGPVLDLDPAGSEKRSVGFLARHWRGPGANPLQLAGWGDQYSIVAESFRAALTSLWFQEQQNGRSHVFVVTSPSAGEGKTTTATNLGIALASSNRRVLLIDGDLRRPMLGKAFGLDQVSGLANILEDRDSLALRSVESLVMQTQVPGLYVLPGGTSAVNITNLRYYDRLMELVAQLRLEFHTVLVDTPPVLAFSDARILGRLSDGVILVVRAAKTQRDDAAAALRRFQEDGTRVLGTILNDWNPKQSGYGSGYRSYGYYSGQGREQAQSGR